MSGRHAAVEVRQGEVDQLNLLAAAINRDRAEDLRNAAISAMMSGAHAPGIVITRDQAATAYQRLIDTGFAILLTRTDV